jgi:hypothetical protein
MSVLLSLGSVAVLAFLIFQVMVALGLLNECERLKRSSGPDNLPMQERLPLGSMALELFAYDLRSGQRFETHQSFGRLRILLFVTPDCSVCDLLARSTRDLEAGQFTMLIPICVGNKEECGAFLPHFNAKIPLLYNVEHSVLQAYDISSYPTAVILDARGRVRGYGYPKDLKELWKIADEAILSS